jgi:M6 family metalloprotease-like protein
MFTHPKGLDAYWREASYNAINLAGSQVFGWYTLPQPRSFYVVGGHQDMTKTREDCTAAADADVQFPDYAGITMMFNGDIDSGYFGITQFNTVTLDGTPKNYPFIWIDTKGDYNEALTAHEMGHALGIFGHSGVFDANGDYVAGDSWDLLGGTCRYSSSDATYGCIQVHPVAPSKDILGWIAPSRIFTATTGVSATIRLEQLAQPGPGNYLIAKIPIAGSTTHFYSVEARRKVGFDNTTHFISDYSIPGSAVLIHEVDLVNFGANHHLIPFRLDPADDKNDPGGADAMWTPGRTFIDAARNISVTVVSETTSGFVVRIQNGVAPIGKLYLPMTMR